MSIYREASHTMRSMIQPFSVIIPENRENRFSRCEKTTLRTENRNLNASKYRPVAALRSIAAGVRSHGVRQKPDTARGTG
jgi:hypothetical protein